MNELLVHFTTTRENGRFCASLFLIDNYAADLQSKLLGYLHPDEKARYDTFPSAHRQQSFLLGRYAAKRAISSLFPACSLSDILIVPGVFHQPVIKSGGLGSLEVSITHKRVCAASVCFPQEHPMSIDMEYVHGEDMPHVLRCLTEAERRLVASLPVDQGIVSTAVWTAKECLSKVLKTGLTVRLDVLEVSQVSRSGQDVEVYFKHFIQYKTCSKLIGDKIITVLLPKNSKVNCTIAANSFQNTFCSIT